MDESEAEFFVTRDVIIELFSPPISDSTFFDMVNAGRIAKARFPRGYYLINKTRQRLGLPPVAEKPTSQREKLSRRVLAQFALKLCLPDLMLLPSELLNRHWLDQVEGSEVEKLVRQFEKDLAALSPSDSKLEYAQGVMDAVFLASPKTT